MKEKIIIGIDLAGNSKNPTGIAILEKKKVKTLVLHTDEEILSIIKKVKPTLVAIDAPLHLPKSGIFRKADKMAIKKGYRVFPPLLPSMKHLTLRAIRLRKLIQERKRQVIEVHPTSSCKALNIPKTDWEKLQTILMHIGIEGEAQVRTLTVHEIDAIIACLTGYLYLKNQTEAIGDEEEGYIIVPKKKDWRKLK